MYQLSQKLNLINFSIYHVQTSGYTSPFHLDRDQFDGGIVVFIMQDIPVKFFCTETKPIEGLYIERNFCKKKWLLSCSYYPDENNIMNHLDALRRNLDLYSTQYEHLILLWDSNVESK